MLDCQIKKYTKEVTIRRCEIKMAFNGDGLELILQVMNLKYKR